MMTQIETPGTFGEFMNAHNLCVRGNVMFGENLVVTRTTTRPFLVITDPMGALPSLAASMASAIAKRMNFSSMFSVGSFMEQLSQAQFELLKYAFALLFCGAVQDLLRIAFMHVLGCLDRSENPFGRRW